MAKRLAEKLLLIGWDAADWEIIRPLVAAGQMPHLERLIMEGVSGDLASLEPMLSPMLWTSIATGKYPHRHGIHGFTEPCPDGSGIRPASSTSRTAKAIWNILTQRGLRTHNVGWYASHPAEPVNGVSVSNHYSIAPRPGLPWDVSEGTIHPPELSGELARLRLRPEELGVAELQPFIPQVARINPEHDVRPVKCAVILAETATTHAAATWIMEHRPWDFMAVLYDSIDHFSHMFMEYHPPQQPHISAADFEHYQHVVAMCYRFHDLMLGRLLDLAGKDTTVLIVSDHGFRSGELRLRETVKTLEGLSKWHRPQGVFVLHGPNIRGGARLNGASLLDVTPTILTLFGLPVGLDMDGWPWLEAIEGADAPEPIASWEHVPGDAGLHPADMRQSPADSMQVLRHLIDLGYLAAPGADTRQAIEISLETNRYNLGRALLHAGLPTDAVAVLKPLVQKHPDDADYRKALSQARRSCEGRELVGGGGD